MNQSRRELIGTVAGLTLAGCFSASVSAETTLARGALASNRTAGLFAPVPSSLHWPDIAMIGPNGAHHFSQLRGKYSLVPLWADWCPPCLNELGSSFRHGGHQSAHSG